MRRVIFNFRIYSPIAVIISLISTSCSGSPETKERAKTEISVEKDLADPKKKVILVNSCHRGYDWSDGVAQGVLDTVMDSMYQIDNARSKVNLKIINWKPSATRRKI